MESEWSQVWPVVLLLVVIGGLPGLCLVLAQAADWVFRKFPIQKHNEQGEE
jgi:hypothetical protein